MEMSMFVTVPAQELATDPELEQLVQEELQYAMEKGGAKSIRFTREPDGDFVRIKAIGEQE